MDIFSQLTSFSWNQLLVAACAMQAQAAAEGLRDLVAVQLTQR